VTAIRSMTRKADEARIRQETFGRLAEDIHSGHRFELMTSSFRHSGGASRRTCYNVIGEQIDASQGLHRLTAM